MFKKVCVILTSLCLLAGCSSNEDLNKDKETKDKDEKTSEVTKVKTSKVSNEKSTKESSKSSAKSSKDKPSDSTSKETVATPNKTASKQSNQATSKNTETPVKEEPVSTNDSSASAPSQPVQPEAPIETVPKVPSTPPAACPGGYDPSLPCDFISDGNYYFATFASEGEAFAQGQYYLDQVMYIGDKEITNYSVQPVYRNDQSIAYYGLNLWSNGMMIY